MRFRKVKTIAQDLKLKIEELIWTHIFLIIQGVSSSSITGTWVWVYWLKIQLYHTILFFFQKFKMPRIELWSVFF